MLPDFLKTAIEKELEGSKTSKLASLTEELSKRYREGSSFFMTEDGHRLAYLGFRFPATYAAVERVLQEISLKLPSLSLTSILDAGSGPGTASFAAYDVFGIQKATLLEKDFRLIEMGKRLANEINLSWLWKNEDLIKLKEVQKHDLVVLSYSIGEIPEAHWPKLLSLLWENTEKIFVVIEPGTPHGFGRIRKIRESLISFGGHIVAPCPHQGTCPMQGTDWCHFSKRLERSSLHRKIKDGALGYEDEKFSYMIFSKEKVSDSSSRILRHPIKNPGHVSLTLCTKDGIVKKTFSKKDKELYRMATKAEWGQEFIHHSLEAIPLQSMQSLENA